MTLEPLAQETIDEFVVASHHDLPRVQEMLTQNSDLLNENATWIETPIQAAAHVGNRPIAEYLLGQGAPLDICTASMLGRVEDVKALLADNPELSGATGAHNIPLMFYPALSDSVEIAQILFEAGADVNAGEGGNTPLHGAAITGHVNVLRWLLDHDANPYAVDYEGKTPLDRAQANGHEAAAALLQPFFEESKLSMSRADNAVQRLYEDADLRDELTDDEANQMLKWAEGELTRLDASSADDAAFEAKLDTLLDLLKKMNRFAGRQGQLTAQASDQAPTNIAALATELGHAANAEQIAAAGTGDPAGTISALTALMSEAGATESASLPIVPPVQPPADGQSNNPPSSQSSDLSFGDDFDETDL